MKITNFYCPWVAFIFYVDSIVVIWTETGSWISVSRAAEKRGVIYVLLSTGVDRQNDEW
jgi:hypothetical protein